MEAAEPAGSPEAALSWTLNAFPLPPSLPLCGSVRWRCGAGGHLAGWLRVVRVSPPRDVRIPANVAQIKFKREVNRARRRLREAEEEAAPGRGPGPFRAHLFSPPPP